MDNEDVFFTKKVKRQGKTQKVISVPADLWEHFPEGTLVKVTRLQKGGKNDE